MLGRSRVEIRLTATRYSQSPSGSEEKHVLDVMNSPCLCVPILHRVLRFPGANEISIFEWRLYLGLFPVFPIGSRHARHSEYPSKSFGDRAYYRTYAPSLRSGVFGIGDDRGFQTSPAFWLDLLFADPSVESFEVRLADDESFLVAQHNKSIGLVPNSRLLTSLSKGGGDSRNYSPKKIARRRRLPRRQYERVPQPS